MLTILDKWQWPVAGDASVLALSEHVAALEDPHIENFAVLRHLALNLLQQGRPSD